MVNHPRGVCRICGKNRALYDETRKLCKECSQKLNAGQYSESDIQTRIQGRRVKLNEKKNDDKNELTFQDYEHTYGRKPLPDAAPEESVPAKHKKSSSKTKKQYRCEHCNAVIPYGQRICPECGQWLCWLHTAAETDPDLVICPECGAALGSADNHLDECPKCGYK